MPLDDQSGAYWTGASSGGEQPQQPLGTARMPQATGWQLQQQPLPGDWVDGTSALQPQWQETPMPGSWQQSAPQQTAQQPDPLNLPRNRYTAPPRASDYDPVWATSVFEEHGEAPELREARSENLNNREGAFWQEPGEQAKGHERKLRRSNTARRRVIAAALVLAGLLTAAVLGVMITFRVRSVTVEGNETIPAAQIIQLAGVGIGQSTLSLNEAKISERIASNRYLSFICMEVTWPDKVVLKVRERAPAACIRCNGILFTLDNRGMVLEETLDTSADMRGLVSVGGLNPRRCEVGHQLIPADQERMEIYRQVMIEATVLDCTGELAELNLSDKENLSVLTSRGFSVRLGTSERLHAKLRSMLLTEEALEERGYSAGSIDVSSPEKPTYIP